MLILLAGDGGDASETGRAVRSKRFELPLPSLSPPSCFVIFGNRPVGKLTTFVQLQLVGLVPGEGLLVCGQPTTAGNSPGSIKTSDRDHMRIDFSSLPH